MYAKLCPWYQKTLQQLDSIDDPKECVEKPDGSYDQLFSLEPEMKLMKMKAEEALALGQDLMCEIQSETDYPAEYLNNVTEKVQLLKQQMSQLEENYNVPEILTQLAYWRKKKELYQQLEDLSKMLHTISDKCQQASDLADWNNCQAKLKTHMVSLQVVKELAKATLLHPGAIADPANSIKADLYAFCDRFEALEQTVSAKYETSKGQTLKTKDVEQKVKEHEEAVEAITVWMAEVSPFLIVEDAAFGDLVNLEAQLKDSDALVADVETLRTKLDEVNASAAFLADIVNLNDCKDRINLEIEAVNAKWQEIAESSKMQNSRLKRCLDESKHWIDNLNEITSFLTQLKRDLPKDNPVTQPAELSQRTYKLLHFKDKIERKGGILRSLETVEKASTAMLTQLSEVKESWTSTCEPVIEEYNAMKMASAEYGEFKTLQAQESDWLERLEKKLQKSTNTAADAEEISEELNEIEHFLDNHDKQNRLERINALAESLSSKRIKICHWQKEAEKLVLRWTQLKGKAKSRTALLEKSIAEAQEWEYKLIAVQDWLTERDILLTSHLEHELTVDDLPDESQVSLTRPLICGLEHANIM